MSSVVRKRQYVYAASVTGTFQKVHRWSGFLLQVILFAVPWMVVGDHPAILFDLPHRRLFAFGQIFGPTDTIFLVLIGLFVAFLLFFVTSIFGRVWCGYMCPQTVFLEEWVRRIEIAIEGERGQRFARDQGPLTFDKAWRKAAKWSAFLLLSTVVAMTLMSYFVDAYTLWGGAASSTAYALVAVLAGVLYLDFAWFREQFCNFLCPYARFQGALTDEHSLTITYDSKRGEPRGARGSGHGACIDCNKCVVVCPAGIDIRDGYQLECIACARCIDACESVMAKRETLPSLVQYTTLARQEGGTTSILRPRTAVYASLLVVIGIAFGVLLKDHSTIDAAVARAPGTMFAVDPDGTVRNTFMLHVTNNHPSLDGQPEPLKVHIEGLTDAQVTVQDLELKETESVTVPLIIRVGEGGRTQRTVPFTIRVSSPHDEVRVKATFETGEQLDGVGASEREKP